MKQIELNLCDIYISVCSDLNKNLKYAFTFGISDVVEIIVNNDTSAVRRTINNAVAKILFQLI